MASFNIGTPCLFVAEMSSDSIQSNITATLKPATAAPFSRPSVFRKTKTPFSGTRHYGRQLKIEYSNSLSALDPVIRQESAAEDCGSNIRPERKKLGVVVKPNEKPRLVLKFIWMQNDIGIAIDQMIPGHGTIPLSPYYFWPKKDAWEELKAMLESKPWISRMEKINLLNQATDIINLWQKSRANES